MSGANPNRQPGGGAGRGRQMDARRDVKQDAAEAKMLPIAGWILVLTGKHKGEDFRLREGKNTVGSTPDCEVVLTDDHISQKHAVITVKRGTDTAGQYSVVDLDSTNGTFLNDNAEKAVREELVDNDVITFGKTRCKFKGV
jgi:pSer/pThr/pTyr-binding forkhead associated (FHA) protein